MSHTGRVVDDAVPSDALDHMLASNRDWLDRFQPGRVPAPPARGLTVITCMDARIVPLEVFGLGVGDAHVLRNAGGRVTPDVLRSLAVSTCVYGVRSVAVVHHTECGMALSTQRRLTDIVGTATGAAPTIDFLAIADAHRALLGDVAQCTGSGLLARGTRVAGYSYDVHSGRLVEVVPPTSAA